MVAFILHKPGVITWMREKVRWLKWGSVDAAAQVCQAVIFSTEMSGRLQAAGVNTRPLS